MALHSAQPRTPQHSSPHASTPFTCLHQDHTEGSHPTSYRVSLSTMPSHLLHSPKSAKISCWQRLYNTAFTPRGHRMSRLSRPICSLGAQLGGMPGMPESSGAASSASLLPALATDSAGPPNMLAIRAGDAACITRTGHQLLSRHAQKRLGSLPAAVFFFSFKTLQHLCICQAVSVGCQPSQALRSNCCQTPIRQRNRTKIGTS